MTDGGKPVGKQSMGFIVAALLLTLVGIGAGLSVGAMILSEETTSTDAGVELDGATSEGHSAKSSGDHGNAKDSGHGDEDDVTSGVESSIEHAAVKIVPLPPVLTTLAEPPGRWIRLEASALMLKETDEPSELLAEKAGEQILTYLRTVRLEEIEGASGTLALRQDINEMLRVLSGDQVQGILIHGLLVE